MNSAHEDPQEGPLDREDSSPEYPQEGSTHASAQEKVRRAARAPNQS